MAITRTKVTAVVEVEVVRKDENGVIVNETLTKELPGCDSRVKAEIILEKEYPKAIVMVKTISFKLVKRKMEDEIFNEHSEVISEEQITEEQLAERKEKKTEDK